MNFKQFLEGEVVRARFGSKAPLKDTGIEVPQGYERFQLDGRKIMGLKNGDWKVVSSVSDERLGRALVQAYNNGGKTDADIKPVSMMQAFGSKDLAAADDAGIKLTEKPSYWDDFEGDGYAAKRNLNELSLKKLEKTVGKLKVYDGQDIYGHSQKPRGPLVKVNKMPEEDMFIVKFDDGTRYVADQTGANTYIRMWQKID